jgi:hypothetical protein
MSAAASLPRLTVVAAVAMAAMLPAAFRLRDLERRS